MAAGGVVAGVGAALESTAGLITTLGGGSGGSCTTTLSDPFGLFAANGGQGDDNPPEDYYD
jgi:hypothetical protein